MSVNHAAYAAAAADPAVMARIEGRLIRPADAGGCWSWDGGHTGKGRAQVKAHGRMLYVHRVLWVAEHPGETPPQLDHICGNGAGGCINPSHLRAATSAQNSQNLRSARAGNSSSGVRGVHWHTRHSKWQAQVQLGGRHRSLGVYTDLADAERAARVGRRLGMPFSAEDKDVSRAEVNAAYRAATPTVRRHFDELAEIGAAAFVSVHRVPA